MGGPAYKTFVVGLIKQILDGVVHFSQVQTDLRRHEQEARFGLLDCLMLSGEEGLAHPVRDHGVLGLSTSELGDALLPGLLVPGLA